MKCAFILFLFLFNFSFSQNNKEIRSIDSLWAITNDKNAYAEKGSKEMLRLCTEMYYQSKNIGYDTGQLRSVTKTAEIYVNEQNYSEALKKIPEGIELAEKLKDYTNWSSLLMIQGNVNTALGYFQKGKTSLQKALLIADKIPIRDKMHYSKASIYHQIGYNIDRKDEIEDDKIMYDSVLFYFHKAYEESEKISTTYPTRIKSIARDAMNLGAGYFYQNNIPEAEKYMDEFQLLMKDEKSQSNFLPYFRLRGEIENKKKNYPKAIEYFNQGIASFKEYKLYPAELVSCYAGIAEAYEGNKDYKNQADYLEKAKRITDSLSLADKKTVEKVPSEPQKKQQPVNTSIIIVFTVLATALAGCFFFFRKKKTAEKETAVASAENRQEELISNEIDTHHSLVEEQLSTTESQELSHVIELAQKNDKSFLLKFLALYPGFNQQLLAIHPQLTHLDLEYCALIKLNFDTKEIAQFKNTSVNSVESRKYRIRKKLGIATHENMYVWFMDL
ncbi:hypothetical protein NZD88_01545 [Chryseobacterium antibioticum]|uniref:Tetratricopeptide repeat protein n=1 Tax=Chryseobacterium pyrolae TaxID=2987481 RepID=A0ABT2ICW5_9FLAO|nr:hypothetical protein [Chryseobacterium pyrolae]MCT2406238.1 hypothetical protein [Chryseobacterium pyrolae]